ncbi:MAG: hypothetical protein WC231_06925, partial [Dehalococcoidales bacterium]
YAGSLQPHIGSRITAPLDSIRVSIGSTRVGRGHPEFTLPPHLKAFLAELCNTQLSGQLKRSGS